MGFAASQGRLMMLVARKNDLEFKLQNIQQQRLYWANVATVLMMTAARNPEETGPGKGLSRWLEAQRANVARVDKMLEMEANHVNTQREAIVTELEAVRKVISKNIQQSFSLMGRA